jgi:AraC-like DNA-binding protein
MDGVCHSGLPEDCLYECVVFDLGRFVTQNNIVSRELENILDHKRSVQRKLPSDTEGLRETVDQLFFSMRYQQRGYELFVRACLYQLLGIVVRDHLYDNAGAMARRSLNQQASLKNAVQYIREHYMQHVTLEELSRAAGMNRKYFCSFFRSITMKTPFEYLNSYRIEVAGEQLLRSDSTVAQIAVNCGFNDVSYFSKIFRRYMGDTPLNYRKKYKTVE